MALASAFDGSCAITAGSDKRIYHCALYFILALFALVWGGCAIYFPSQIPQGASAEIVIPWALALRLSFGLLSSPLLPMLAAFAARH